MEMKARPPWKISDKRISVMGTRGKTSLTLLLHNELTNSNVKSLCKVTGAIPMVCIGRKMNILRRRGYVRLYENLLDVESTEFCVMENQGISPYTARVFNEIFLKPQIIAVTNVRLDHVEDFGHTRERIASSLSYTFARAELVISGETDEKLNSLMRRRTKKFIAVPSPNPDLPGSEIPAIAKELLELYGFDFDLDKYLIMIRNSLKWRKGDILFYDASKVNDPDSASLILKWLGDAPILAIQLRKDRPGRTWAFLKMIKEKWVDYKSILVSGPWSDMFAKRVKGIRLPDSCKGALKAISISKETSYPLFITGNRRGNFVKCLLEKLGVKEIPLAYGSYYIKNSSQLGRSPH